MARQKRCSRVDKSFYHHVQHKEVNANVVSSYVPSRDKLVTENRLNAKLTKVKVCTLWIRPAMGHLIKEVYIQSVDFVNHMQSSFCFMTTNSSKMRFTIEQQI